MSPQQEAVALFKFFETRGLVPSVRLIGRILRVEYRLNFSDAELRRWITPFSDAAATRRRLNLAADAPQHLSTNDATPPQRRRNAAATPPRLRARDKVSLVSEDISISLRESNDSLVAEADPAEKKTAKNPRLRPEVPTVAFEAEDERRVEALLARIAAGNKTGSVTASRIANERTALKAMLDEYGSEAWRYACDDVVRREGIRDPIPYARGIMRGYSPDQRAPTARGTAPTTKGNWLTDFAYKRPMNEILGGEGGTWDTLAAQKSGKVASGLADSIKAKSSETS